jgi:post-GPI attachment to proteins factor 3
LSLSLVIVIASNGDYDQNFYYCVKDCVKTKKLLQDHYFRKILFWDDISECQYICMREISDAREVKGLSTYKYFGHWPYHRILGIQEPASCLFSFLNAIPHIYNLLYCRSQFTSKTYFMSHWLVAYGCVAVIAWFSSCLFHARKIGILIDLDYMSALLLLSLGLWLAIRRSLAVTIFNKNYIFTSVCFTAGCLIVIYQLGGMVLGHVNFGRHMEVSIAVAACQACVWVLWSMGRPTPHWKTCLIIQVSYIASIHHITTHHLLTQPL